MFLYTHISQCKNISIHIGRVHKTSIILTTTTTTTFANTCVHSHSSPNHLVNSELLIKAGVSQYHLSCPSSHSKHIHISGCNWFCTCSISLRNSWVLCECDLDMSNWLLSKLQFSRFLGETSIKFVVQRCLPTLLTGYILMLPFCVSKSTHLWRRAHCNVRVVIQVCFLLLA